MKRAGPQSILMPAVLALCACTGDPRTEHPYYAGADSSRAQIIAHAGGKALAPENTAEAFALAERMGADVLEGDVHLTKDGVVVLIHDETIDRTTDKTGRVGDMTYAEIEAADAGARFEMGGARPFARSGVRVPKLADALAAHPGRWTIEVKPPGSAAAEALCAELRASGAEMRVQVASFHDDALAAFRAACPQVATSLSGGEAETFFLLSRVYLAFLYEPPGVALQIPEAQGDMRILDERLLAAARAQDLKVEIWTVNEPADMKRLMAMGVDGLMTDRVDLLKALQDGGGTEVAGRSVSALNWD